MNVYWPAVSGLTPAGSQFTTDGSNEQDLVKRPLPERWAGLKKQMSLRDQVNSNVKKPLSPPGLKGQGRTMEILIPGRAGVLERYHFCQGGGTDMG